MEVYSSLVRGLQEAICYERGQKMSEYKTFTDITKEALDTAQVGDLIRINDWENPLLVKGVSENYFIMSDGVEYSICEKKQWEGIRYNAMIGGMFHISTDNLIFGWSGGYDFDDDVNVKKYLDALECGDIGISLRSACPVRSMSIKKSSRISITD